MRTTLKNMAMVLTLAGVTLGASAAMAKGGNNSSNRSSNSGGSFKSFSNSLSSKSLQGMNNSNSSSMGNKSFKLQSAKVFQPQVQSNQGVKLQKLGSNHVITKLPHSQNGNVIFNNVIKQKPKLLIGNNGNAIQNMPKGTVSGLINHGGLNKIGLNKGGKAIDPGFGLHKNQGNFNKHFAKNKCFDKFCWPWWGFGCSPCHNWCYDPCWYGGGYNGCYGGGVIVVEKPVVVAQPVNVEQNVAVEQPAVDPAVQQAAAVEPAAADAVAAKIEAHAANLPKVPVGATITLRGEAFGDEAGKVAMQVGEVLLPATVSKWEAKAVTITLPQIGLAAAAKGKFLILKADGELANEIPFELVPPQGPAVSQQ